MEELFLKSAEAGDVGTLRRMMTDGSLRDADFSHVRHVRRFHDRLYVLWAEVATFLVSRRADPDVVLSGVYGNLVGTTINGCHAVVDMSLCCGADVDTRDDCGDTSLWWAVENGEDDVVRLLLDHGVDRYAAGDPAQTSIACAAYWHDLDARTDAADVRRSVLEALISDP